MLLWKREPSLPVWLSGTLHREMCRKAEGNLGFAEFAASPNFSLSKPAAWKPALAQR